MRLSGLLVGAALVSEMVAQPVLNQLSHGQAARMTEKINEKRRLHGACAIQHVGGVSTGVVAGGSCRQGLAASGGESFFLNYYSGNTEFSAKEPIDEWYGLGSSDSQYSSMLWTDATSFSCEYCTDGDAVGHMTYLSCIFDGVPKDAATLNAQRSLKVLPVNSPPCNICLKITCPTAPVCKTQLPCDPASGCPSQTNMPPGSSCDDSDPTTYNDKCDGNGVCVGERPCAGIQCPPTSQCNTAGSCVVDVVNGVGTARCDNPLKMVGTPCNDGNHITVNDACDASGACRGVDLCQGVTCSAQSQCHDIGTCDQTTGQCSNPIKPVGTVCDDGDSTTYNDACDTQSVCVGNRPCVNHACPAPSGCHQLGSCVVQVVNGVYVPSCVNQPQPMGTACDDNDPMTASDQCDGNGNCNGVNNCVGVTCQAASQCHSVGLCDPLTGQCSTVFKPSGTQCFDGNPNTVADSCDGQGTCTGTDHCTGVVCSAIDSCHEVGTCDVQTGTCSTPIKMGLIPCDDNDPLTKDDVCNRLSPGVCSGIPLCDGVTCTPPNQCVSSMACNPQNGQCEITKYQPSGTSCDDSNPNTVNDVCDGTGTCAGTNLCQNVVCPVKQCITAGTCNSQTGNCDYTNQPDNTVCDDGDPLTGNDVCNAGVCKGSDLCAGVHCQSQPNSCMMSKCDPQQGICVSSQLPNNSPCDDSNPNTGSDICLNGVCSGSTDCELVVLGDYGKATCELHKNFGYASNGKLFTDQGCRGKFQHKTTGEVIRCSSSQFGYTECKVDQLRPECAKLSLIPCPSATDCHGYQKLGSGRCLDAKSEEYRTSRADGIPTINECLRIAKGASGGDVVGVQYDKVTHRCYILIPKGSLPVLRNSAPWDAHDKTGTGEGSVQNIDFSNDIECWVPDNRCTGVTCKAADKCHVKGFCNPNTGRCSNPPAADGTWCNDYQKNVMKMRDTCQSGVCTASPEGCWIPSKWWPSTECKNVKSACTWGSGVYSSEAECCTPGKGHAMGCYTPPPTPTECWRASKWWPTKECFNDNNACQWGSWNKPGGVFASEADCCKPGAAHKSGCSSYTPPPPVKFDPTLSTTPSQCLCQLNNNCTASDPVCKSQADPSFQDYCGCSKINKVSKVRYCVSQDGTNTCNRPNVWGECPAGTTVCSALPSYSLRIKKNKSISTRTIKNTFGRCSGSYSIVKVVALCPVNACPRVSGRRICPKSIASMKQWGCTIISTQTYKNDRAASILGDDGDEEQVAVFDIEGAEDSKLFETIDLAMHGSDSDIATASGGDSDLQLEITNLRSMLTGEQASETPKPEEELEEDEPSEDSSSESSTPIIIGSIISMLLLASGCFIYNRSKEPMVNWVNVAEQHDNLCDVVDSQPVSSEMVPRTLADEGEDVLL